MRLKIMNKIKGGRDDARMNQLSACKFYDELYGQNEE